MAIPVFPSLARGIAWGSSQKIEDGTLRDKMEMGQVMARQRFSRLRRTWKVEYQYLDATDLALIDQFYRETVQGGSLPFYWPNLLDNGGFETNSVGPDAGTTTQSVLCDGWHVSPGGGGCTAKLATGVAQSGAQCLQLDGIAGYDLAPSGVGLRVFSNPAPAKPGQTIQVAGSLDIPLGALPSGAVFEARIGLFFFDVIGGQLLETYPADTTAPTTQYGWTTVSTAAVAPANTASAVAECCLFLQNNTGAAMAMPSAPWVSARFDNIGLALVASAPAYGVMPSNGPIPVQVRFPKPPDFADAGWVGNRPTYRAQFELEEV